MSAGSVEVFAPGRVNIIGEHTDYNGGLSLPFAMALGVRVVAERRTGQMVEACATDLGETRTFDPARAAPHARLEGWAALVQGTVTELREAGCDIGGCRITIAGDLPWGQGLGSSAALAVALAMALLHLSERPRPHAVALAGLCSSVEHRWVGTQSGLLDQLASISGEPGRALRIDFASLTMQPVECALDGWTLALVGSGESRTLAGSGYNARRDECGAAARLLGIGSLRGATRDAAAELPAPLDRRVLHVISENERVDSAVAALGRADMEQLAALLNASHASLRDLYAVSTPAVEATVEEVLRRGARGARIMGGGFGGRVLALFPPGLDLPDGSLPVAPHGGARVVRG